MQNKDTKKIASVPKYKKLLLILALFFILVGTLIIFINSTNSKYLEVNGRKIYIEVADNKDELINGLSGRSTLSDESGLLLSFGSEGYWGIWMKDMNFPIDIIWLDRNGVVVDIEMNVKPESYPEVFKPSEKSKYVLEMLAGSANRYSIEKQTQIKNVMLN